MTEKPSYLRENLAVASLRDAGPGGICEDCGHFAIRHKGLACLFPRPKAEPCTCNGMLWLGQRLSIGSHGPEADAPR